MKKIIILLCLSSFITVGNQIHVDGQQESAKDQTTQVILIPDGPIQPPLED